MNTIQAILRLRQVIRRQHKALATEENYVFWRADAGPATDKASLSAQERGGWMVCRQRY